MLMRGGTSKGAYFLAEDLPADPAARDDLLLRVMGTPDPRQIDGVGGAHPLTSKVAVVRPSDVPDMDVDYLFLQVGVDRAFVTDQQNCGNLLAGVGPFALERGILAASGTEASVRIRLLNTGGGTAVATFPVEDGHPVYRGRRAIAGVPGTAAEIRLDFEGTAGSTCGRLLPTGSVVDRLAGLEVTCVDNGMPVVVVRAADLGVTGHETVAELEGDPDLRATVEKLRLEAGVAMGLGDVGPATIPKMTLVSPPATGGTLCTRSFIPHRVHDAIGVLAAVSVATAALLPGTPAAEVADWADRGTTVVVEHPTGTFDAVVELDRSGPEVVVTRAGIVRTARKLFDGEVFPRPDDG
ncbi:MAG: 4-oxalomesaconate tautomerase [Acidimicrobiales bacterium]